MTIQREPSRADQPLGDEADDDVADATVAPDAQPTVLRKPFPSADEFWQRLMSRPDTREIMERLAKQ
jgi:hypothetical protein